ncbi:MAG: methyltransferase domain-containing protein [Victivallaceae bacterium]|nr:methyltransferase domain-containing protein [Victivallaceae bacterium]
MSVQKNDVKEYYGKTLQHSDDLLTNACCCDAAAVPLHIREILKDIADEVLAKYYGCGSPIPEAVEGCTTLDLGCGTGRDVYTFSKLVGEHGRAVGVDMTDEQLAVANKYVEEQADKFGYAASNVTFIKGDIEDLQSAGIESDSIDIITSNCVINLATDKKKVFKEIFRVLKPGGELYFSDVFSDRRVSPAISNDPIMYGECLGGTLYIEDFRRLLHDIGIPTYCVVSVKPITIQNAEIEAKAGNVSFSSITIRAFKLSELEDRCEDYGQIATYDGGIPFSPHQFDLDSGHSFIKNKPMLVCRNTANILSCSRFGKYFTVTEPIEHFGLFPSCEQEKIIMTEAGCC